MKSIFILVILLIIFITLFIIMTILYIKERQKHTDTIVHVDHARNSTKSSFNYTRDIHKSSLRVILEIFHSHWIDYFIIPHSLSSINESQQTIYCHIKDKDRIKSLSNLVDIEIRNEYSISIDNGDLFIQFCSYLPTTKTIRAIQGFYIRVPFDYQNLNLLSIDNVILYTNFLKSLTEHTNPDIVLEDYAYECNNVYVKHKCMILPETIKQQIHQFVQGMNYLYISENDIYYILYSIEYGIYRFVLWNNKEKKILYPPFPVIYRDKSYEGNLIDFYLDTFDDEKCFVLVFYFENMYRLYLVHSFYNLMQQILIFST